MKKDWYIHTLKHSVKPRLCETVDLLDGFDVAEWESQDMHSFGILCLSVKEALKAVCDLCDDEE